VTRRTALAIAAGAFAGRAEIRYRQYARCFPDFLSHLAKQAYDRRNIAIAKLTSPAAIHERQRWVRETFWKLTGGMPERSSLNLRAVGAFERPRYRVEKLVYESQPGLHIPANLYIPKNHEPPFPGVLFQMGHSLNGKAADTYQKCCQSLAQLGYLVLAFDPMGQGERTYYPRPNGVLTRLPSADDEHSQPGKQMLLVGDTATRMQAWDAVRSLDVLASHPLVDAKRLASTGQSGGGTITMFLTATDERLAAAAVSSGNTENVACEDFNSPGSVDDAEQNFIDAGPAGFDRWDLLYPMAPKPMLVAVSGRDFFGTYSPRYLSNGRPEFDRL
jgi:dienelactone hydrolase